MNVKLFITGIRAKKVFGDMDKAYLLCDSKYFLCMNQTSKPILYRT